MVYDKGDELMSWIACNVRACFGELVGEIKYANGYSVLRFLSPKNTNGLVCSEYSRELLLV